MTRPWPQPAASDPPDFPAEDVQRATDLDAAEIHVGSEPLPDDLRGVRLEVRQLELDKPWVMLSADEATQLSQALLRAGAAVRRPPER
jgi:hypothetical protein